MVENIRIATGCYGAAVVDVNDLKRVAVLAASSGLSEEDLMNLLIDNPFGNDSQKTPIVIIKDYKQHMAAV